MDRSTTAVLRRSQLCPHVALQVETLEKNRARVQYASNIKIDGFQNGNLPQDAVADRFKLSFDFVETRLEWEVIFSSSQPENPPDFVFGSVLENSFTPRIASIPSLLNWNPKDPFALLKVFGELLKAYRNFQRQLVAKHPSEFVRMDFESIRNSPLLDSIEMTTLPPLSPLAPFASRPVKFKYFVTGLHEKVLLSVVQEDLRRFPPCVRVVLSPSEDGSTGMEGGKAEDNVFVVPSLRPLVEHADLRWQPGHDLNDFITGVGMRIEDSIEPWQEQLVLRRGFIATLIASFKGTLLEYDIEGFTKASFLHSVDRIQVLVQFTLASFPEKQPKITLQSIYAERNSKPVETSIQDYPYSPRWPPETMIDRILPHLAEKILQFQKKPVTKTISS